MPGMTQAAGASGRTWVTACSLSFVGRALEQLQEWPALRVHQAGNHIILCAATSGVPIVRLREPDQASLCLTWPVIQRLGEALDSDGRVRVEPGSDWVQVRMHGTSDLRLLVTLVSLAIRAQPL